MVPPLARAARRGEQQDTARDRHRRREDAIWSIAGDDGTATSRLRRLIVAYVRFVTDYQPAVSVWLNDLNAPEPGRRHSVLDHEEQHRQRLVSLAQFGSLNWVHRWFQSGGLPAEDFGLQFSRVFLAGRET